MAYYRHEPFGQDHVHVLLATVAALVANANRNPKKRSKPYEPSDFLPDLLRKEAPAADAVRGKIDAAMLAMGGKPRRK